MDEATPLDDALHHAQLLVGHGGIRVHDGDGCCQVAKGDLIAAQFLQGRIGVGGFVAGIGIDQRAFLLKDGFAQQGDDVLALGEPLAAQAGKFFFRIGFVKAEKARTPAVRKAEAVEVVQHPWPGGGRKSPYRRHAQMLAHGEHSTIDEYGQTNPAEFFAVSTETFFTNPHGLSAEFPDLFRLLRQF